MVGAACLPSNAYYLRAPFILGSMPGGLNILIRHLFTDLCVDYSLDTMTTATYRTPLLNDSV